MSATTTPTYTPVPIVMERAAKNKALREAMLASGKSPLFTALVVCKRENKEEEEESQRLISFATTSREINGLYL